MPCRSAEEGVARPDGVPLVGVEAPSPKGLRLEACSTCGVKETGAGAEVTVATEAATTAAGLVGVTGGDTRGGGAWVIGDTTLTGLCGLGTTNGGGALMAAVEGSEEEVVVFCRGSFVTRAAGGDGGLVDVGLEFCEGEYGIDCFWVWAWFWACSDGAPSVLTTVTAGAAAQPAVKYNDTQNNHMDHHIKVQTAKKVLFFF